MNEKSETATQHRNPDSVYYTVSCIIVFAGVMVIPASSIQSGVLLVLAGIAVGAVPAVRRGESTNQPSDVGDDSEQ